MPEGSLAEQFIELAPQKWREHASLFHGLEATVKRKTETFHKDSTEYGYVIGRIRLVYGHKEGQGIYEWHRVDSTRAMDARVKETYWVLGCNEEYVFDVKKSRAAAGYWIRDVRPRALQHPGNEDIPALSTRTRYFAAQIRRLRNVDLLHIVPSGDFKVTAAGEVVRNGRRLVQIEFQYHPKAPDRAEVVGGIYSSGTIVCDPELYWAVVEARVNVDDPFNEISTIQCQRRIERPTGGIPLVVTSQSRGYDAKGAVFFQTDNQYDWKQFKGDEKAFTLSAYGLPEPSYTKPSRSRLWGFMVTLALLLILITIYLFRQWWKLRGG